MEQIVLFLKSNRQPRVQGYRGSEGSLLDGMAMVQLEVITKTTRRS